MGNRPRSPHQPVNCRHLQNCLDGKPTGTDAALDFVPNEHVERHHLLPKVVQDHPEITVTYQNEHIDLMEESREKYEKLILRWSFQNLLTSLTLAMLVKITIKFIAAEPYEGMTDDIRNGGSL